MTEQAKRLRFSAEDEDLFNSARILMLFEILDAKGKTNGINIERIAYYDFFSAQPFLVFGKEERDAKLELLFQGFESTTVGYISSSQRFTNRTEKLKHYLAGLLTRDLITVKNIDGQLLYSITHKGRETVSKFKSMYTKAYKSSAEIIIHKLSKLSDKRLAENAKIWLKAEPFIIDLYDF
jgi:hypothetical protein